MFDFRLIIEFIVLLIILLFVCFYFSISYYYLVIGLFYPIILLIKSKKILSSKNNLSKYDNDSFINFYYIDITKYLVFKKSNFNLNRLYWEIKNEDDYYYTNNCNEADTIKEIFNKINFSARSETIDKFVECLFVNQMISKGKNKLMNPVLLSKDKEIKYEFRKSNILICYNYITLNQYLNKETGLKPDVFLKINDFNYIIDIKNMVNKGYLNKYDSLTDDNTCVIFIYTNLDRREGALVDCRVEIVCTLKKNDEKIMKFIELFGDMFENDFKKILLESVGDYNFDRNYWLNNFYSKKIKKSKNQKHILNTILNILK